MESEGTESESATRPRADAVFLLLRGLYPAATTELVWHSPFQLLIATMLSAQATDKSVNAATPELFAHFPNAETLAAAKLEEVEGLIRKIGLYRNKARNIIAAAQLLVQEHLGQVPNDFAALCALPGVGRKTANVVLSNAYGRPAIAVDTHVGRLARRLGFSGEFNPDRVERDLEALIPREDWVFAHHALILHGRRICTARRPLCAECHLEPCCPKIGVIG